MSSDYSHFFKALQNPRIITLLIELGQSESQDDADRKFSEVRDLIQKDMADAKIVDQEEHYASILKEWVEALQKGVADYARDGKKAEPDNILTL